MLLLIIFFIFLMSTINSSELIKQEKTNSIEFNDPSRAKKEIETLISRPLKSIESSREIFDPFKSVMGISEKEFKALSVDQKQSYIHQNNLTNQHDQSFFAGTVELNSIETLRAQQSSSKPSSFTVVEAYDKPWEHWFRPFVDVTALQADPHNKDAVFQIASNFNALEGNGNPNDGIMTYLSPGLYVQGEAAALSAMPGLINRMYFQDPINFLDALYPDICVTNGYITSINKKLFNTLTQQQKQNYINQIKIGFHENIQVTGGLGPLKNELPTYKAIKVGKKQLINQVFSAAMMNPNIYSQADVNVAQLLLQASYEGVLSYASFKHKKKVFLTLIGGGVFNNPLEWIIDALEKSIREFNQHGGLDITLIVFYSQSHDVQEWQKAKIRLLTLTQDMKGSYLRYKKNGLYKVTLE